MKVVARLDENCHAHLIAYFWCSQFEEPKRIHFVIDTGCSITTILNDEATLIGIDCSSLNPACATQTANGEVIPYEIPNVILMFRAKYGLFNIVSGFKGTQLEKVHCHLPTNPSLMTEQRRDNAVSLLGMDFLRRFKKWKFTERELFLST